MALRGAHFDFSNRACAREVSSAAHALSGTVVAKRGAWRLC